MDGTMESQARTFLRFPDIKYLVDLQNPGWAARRLQQRPPMKKPATLIWNGSLLLGISPSGRSEYQNDREMI
jgi:hypothetical protein